MARKRTLTWAFSKVVGLIEAQALAITGATVRRQGQAPHLLAIDGGSAGHWADCAAIMSPVVTAGRRRANNRYYGLTVEFTEAEAAAMTATIASVSPDPLYAGQGGTTLTITGTGFTGASVARVRGTSRPTTFVSPTALTVALPAPDLARPGLLHLTVDDGAIAFVRLFLPLVRPAALPPWVPPPSRRGPDQPRTAGTVTEDGRALGLEV